MFTPLIKQLNGPRCHTEKEAKSLWQLPESCSIWPPHTFTQLFPPDALHLRSCLPLDPFSALFPPQGAHYCLGAFALVIFLLFLQISPGLILSPLLSLCPNIISQ